MIKVEHNFILLLFLKKKTKNNKTTTKKSVTESFQEEMFALLKIILAYI